MSGRVIMDLECHDLKTLMRTDHCNVYFTASLSKELILLCGCFALSASLYVTGYFPYTVNSIDRCYPIQNNAYCLLLFRKTFIAY